MSQLEELKVRITPSINIPDPTDIATAGDWYYLDHIGSGLVAFDATKKKFVPMLAEKWASRSDGIHVFTLKAGIKFHDGTPITVKDVLWSIKRQLIRKTATHFRFWEYIEGCGNLKSLDDDCSGLFAVSDHEVGIKLAEHSESFFLQMASPETGIYSAQDMNPKDTSLKATKFSGPYYVDRVEEKAAVLKRNDYSPLTKAFPNSPKSIRIVKVPGAELDNAIATKQVDLVIRSYRPYGEKDWNAIGPRVGETTNSNIIYLYGTGTGERKPIGRAFLQMLWELNSDKKINSAASFLPFAGGGSLHDDELLSALPAHTEKKLRILCPQGFFAAGFLDLIKRAGAAVGSDVDIHIVPGAEWNKAFDDPTASEKFDYILSSYAASERYPTVQLRYLAGNLTHSPIDLKKVESPEAGEDRAKILRDYQFWLLRTKQVIPLFFNRTLFIYGDNIDIGDQSATDAEIELWRVTKRAQ